MESIKIESPKNLEYAINHLKKHAFLLRYYRSKTRWKPTTEMIISCCRAVRTLKRLTFNS